MQPVPIGYDNNRDLGTKQPFCLYGYDDICVDASVKIQPDDPAKPKYAYATNSH
jgi:hypothetical protein